MDKSDLHYNPVEVEKKWTKTWEENKTFKVDILGAKKPFYNLMMFPYPSGEGLHIGHAYAFGGADTFGRFKRLQGYDVFEPMGFDAFGIHSENFALKKDTHPKELIAATTEYFKNQQLKRFGAIFDWDNSVTTTDPDYYRWTQWLFIQLFKAGLAVRKKAKVDWCPSCLTVLAAEQVIGGNCERCGTEVVQKELEQWFFRITEFAEDLLINLETIDWSETTKNMQRNWIGKSSGAEVTFNTDFGRDITIYTTRVDTIFGATFLAISPEHPMLYSGPDLDVDKINKDILKDNYDVVKDYVKNSLGKSDQDRIAAREKTGAFTGLYAINPANKKRIPIYVADFVLSGYGTGAIMGVPAHDERDFEFAKKYDLDILEVIKEESLLKKTESKIPQNNTKLPFIGQGVLIDSDKYSGTANSQAKEVIAEDLVNQGLAKKRVNYHLRDWLISRQRYWGPPIPMIYCEDCSANNISWFDLSESKVFESRVKTGNSARMPGWFPVPEEDLPVLLPYVKNFKPLGTGSSPLEQDESFVSVSCPNCGAEARRETDVSDTFLDSSWYFLRYPNVELAEVSDPLPWSEQVLKKWLPVDMYIGGNEHAVLHLLYTRFVTMALHRLGYLGFAEPFKKFRAHGLITYKGAKMSKSRGNVINPNEYFDTYGVETTKLYLLFIGPYEEGGDWTDRGIVGLYRFIQKVWVLVNRDLSSEQLDQKRKKKRAEVIKNVTTQLNNLQFNTTIASLMEYSNYLSSLKNISKEEIEVLITLLAPLAPFTAEESWQKLTGQIAFENKNSIHNQPWPSFNESDLANDVVTLVIQVNGRFKGKFDMDSSLANQQSEVISRIKGDSTLGSLVSPKYIFVPGKIINFVPEK